VNVPPQVLADPQFCEHLHDKMNQYGVNSQFLRLEITENALINDFDLVKNQLDKLSQTNIHFGIDDFGTGFSSLSYLTNLPIDFVKLDKLFIDRMVNNKFDAAVVQKIVQLIHRLGYDTIAEGIDTERKYIYVMAYQCTKAQGHYFGKAKLVD
jgi:EAL domain-containing protein (putative c-di-GMP-specific phosphodiesterase class I)